MNDQITVMKLENMTSERLKGDKNPFLVPDGYFEESRARIMESIAAEQVENVPGIIRLRSGIIWAAGIAASLVVGFLLFQNLYLKPAQSEKLAQEIEWLINYAGPELNSATLAYFASEEGLNLDELTGSEINTEQTVLLEMTEYEEIFIIEEWMKYENQ